MNRKLIVGISGASGAPIAVAFLETLKSLDIEPHLIVSGGAEKTVPLETPYKVKQINGFADVVYDNSNIGASLASGSFKTMGMVVVPCSMKALAGIHSGL